MLRINELLAFALNARKRNIGLRKEDLNMVRSATHCLVTITILSNNREID